MPGRMMRGWCLSPTTAADEAAIVLARFDRVMDGFDDGVASINDRLDRRLAGLGALGCRIGAHRISALPDAGGAGGALASGDAGQMIGSGAPSSACRHPLPGGEKSDGVRRVLIVPSPLGEKVARKGRMRGAAAPVLGLAGRGMAGVRGC